MAKAGCTIIAAVPVVAGGWCHGSVVVGCAYDDDAPSSVHGSSVFANFRKDRKIAGSMRRATSSDGLSRMNGGLTISF